MLEVVGVIHVASGNMSRHRVIRLFHWKHALPLVVLCEMCVYRPLHVRGNKPMTQGLMVGGGEAPEAGGPGSESRPVTAA